MRELVLVKTARHVRGYLVELEFTNSTRKVVDIRPWLSGSVVAAIRRPSAIRKFFVAGGTICWPNGADIAPEALLAASDAKASAA